jgi:hypothetical protein
MLCEGDDSLAAHPWHEDEHPQDGHGASGPPPGRFFRKLRLRDSWNRFCGELVRALPFVSKAEF